MFAQPCLRKTNKKRRKRLREGERETNLYFLVFIARVRSHGGGGKKGVELKWKIDTELGDEGEDGLLTLRAQLC